MLIICTVCCPVCIHFAKSRNVESQLLKQLNSFFPPPQASCYSTESALFHDFQYFCYIRSVCWTGAWMEENDCSSLIQTKVTAKLLREKKKNSIIPHLETTWRLGGGSLSCACQPHLQTIKRALSAFFFTMNLLLTA